MNEDRRYWFPAKSYGWGWGFPTTWEGVAVLLVFVALTMGAAVAFPPSLDPFAFAACLVVLCGLLMAICRAKGEPPRWRWGDDE